MICIKDDGSYKNCKRIGELTDKGHQVLAFRFDGYNTWLFFDKNVE